MRNKNILLTGGSGTLGKALTASGYFPNIHAPSRQSLDITNPQSIEKVFHQQHFDALIHCAALARMEECERDPERAISANIIGTCHLVTQVLKNQKTNRKDTRFIYISTDGVYPGIRGNYSEREETIPYNNYGWTKLGGECAVNLLANFCIIRTSFFDPTNIRFNYSATDMYSSKVSTDYLAKAVAIMLKSDFVGTINIGGPSASDYERYKEFKPSLKAGRRDSIAKNISCNIHHDSSMNVDLWTRFKSKRSAGAK